MLEVHHRQEGRRAVGKAEARENVRTVLDSPQTKPFPITVSVFTSGGCVFCKEALAIVREAARNLSYDKLGIEIVELPVDEKPDLVESLDIMAVPTIQIGRARLVGLPNIEEIESLMHGAILTPNK